MERKKILLLIIIILVAGITVQTIRMVELAGLFAINQVGAAVAVDHPIAQKIPVPEDYLKLYVLYSNEDDGSRQLKDNIYHTANMAKLNTVFIDIGSDRSSEIIKEIRAPDLLVIATERLSALKNYQNIINFVAEGGRAVFLIRSLFAPFDLMTGITVNQGFKPEAVIGIKFQEKIFPGLDETDFDNLVHSVLDVDLDQSVHLLATSADHQPLIWTKRFGDGEVLYVNSTMMQSKNSRGLMMQCLAYLPDFFVSTIFNAVVFQIDDFPAPIKFGQHPKIYPYYQMNTPEFFKQVWWPDTYNFVKQHRLKLTGLAIGTFNEDTVAPLDLLNDMDREQIMYFGRRLSEAGGELGIHGYNHQSLALEGQMRFADYGYSPWESQETMEEGLAILKTALNEMFGDITFYTYAAPSNLVSGEGRSAVKNVFKDVKIFAGIYLADREEPGLLVQEFGRDPYLPDVVSFPRISSGYLYDKNKMWSIYSGIAHFGLVHHFIHPDDLFDEQRSGGLTWEEMNRQINTIFTEIRKRFPFLRAMTTLEAYQYFVKTEDLQVYVNSDREIINIRYNKNIAPVYHFLRLRNKRVIQVEGGNFVLVCRQRNLYLIEGRQSQVSILIGQVS